MATLLGIIIVICILLVVFYVARTVELTKEIKGELEDTSKSSNVQGYLMLSFLVFFFIGIAWSSYYFLPRMLPAPASLHGVEIQKLFNITLLFTGIVFIFTHIFLFWFAFKYREQKGRKAYFFSHSNMLELIWTAIPAVVMMILVAKGMITWLNIFPSTKDMAKDKLVIEVTAQQFKWNLRYPGVDGNFGERKIDQEHIGIASKEEWWKNEFGINWEDPASHDDFFSDTLYLVKNKPTLCKLGALDVLHSFYLPHFSVKMDCVPGVPTTFYFTPTQTTLEKRQELSKIPEWQKINEATGSPRFATFNYELACAELCGKSHYAMQKYVMVVEQAEYDKWVKSHVPAYEAVKKAKEEAGGAKSETKEKGAESTSAEMKDIKLSSGFAMNVSSTGVENKLVSFIEDKTKMVDKTTWFSFDRLLFETGKSTLKPESEVQLKNIVEIMKAFPNVEIKLGGYTDNVGDVAKNVKLSADRANNVMAELVKMGVAASRIKAEGFGPEFPVASNDTEEGRTQNRRIDVRVTKK
jgi:cytochrome c oxidase subunit 2